jgi:hypothetical protein
MITKAKRTILDFRHATIAVVLVVFSAGSAWATHDEPKSAKKLQASLVASYTDCETPNAVTSTGLDACTPPVPPASAAGCTFSPDGSGKFGASVTGSVVAGTQDLRLKASLKGLTAACEARTLCILLGVRATLDDCGGNACTTVGSALTASGPEGCCTVADGRCTIDTTLSAAFPGTFPNGANAGLELGGCALAIDPFVDQPPFLCGVLLK